MEWDYKEVGGNFWNNLPLDKQMEYLEEYYPIGSVFHETQPNPNDPDSRSHFEEYYCIIEGYILAGKNSSWYILEVKNYNPFVKEYTRKHPGFYVPGKSYYRNLKLNELGL